MNHKFPYPLTEKNTDSGNGPQFFWIRDSRSRELQLLMRESPKVLSRRAYYSGDLRRIANECLYFTIMRAAWQASDTYSMISSRIRFVDTDQPVMTAREVDFYYGPSKALNQINLEIHRQKVTAMIGPSGCGKSTFLRCLNRMNDTIPNTQVSGKILLEGMDIYAPGVDLTLLRQRVGMVFQKPNPFPQSIYDNVAFGPRVLGMVRHRNELAEIVESSLTRAALWDIVKDRLNHNAMELSLGQQQLLCIARLLAVQPDVILMDEPASALDPIATERIESLIHELKVDYTIAIVTHNMQQAARISDFTAFFWLGELVEYSPTALMFTRPQNEITETYITGRMG